MEQRRIEGKSHWYHETQSSASRAHALPLVPEAATVNDPFLLDLALPEKQKTDLEGIVSPARKIYALLFPQRVNTSRLRTFSAYDRLSTALTAAQVFGVQRLCNHYAARLAPLSGPDSSRESNYRLAQITQHARQLAASPSVIDARARQQLEDVGLTLYDLVIINQIIGFVAFQARVVAALQASLGQPVRFIPGMETQQEADAALFSDTATEWQPGIDSVDLRTANAPQMESLARWQPLPELRLLAPLLAHEHLLLNELGEMSEQVAKISPNKQQGWLVAAYTARLNGSTSCFTQQVQRGSDNELLAQALRAGSRELNRVLAGKNKESALVQAVQMLTCAPDRLSPAQFLQLEEHGYSRQAAISLLVACALNGWLNRLHIALGQSV
ncbi:CMD domain-containing protein [Kosakonia sacchari]|uniref:carboxymuconolactone decarboxylase family protein n=1 Tax=Kosakonia sacchari TaxID=1158459 RepID=UPI003F577E57